MKIVAIGGGENGRIKSDGIRAPYETKIFDEEIVKLTGKKKPKCLFIAFTQASVEGAEKYYEVIKFNFSNLGCICDHLREADLKDMSIVEKKINEYAS